MRLINRIGEALQFLAYAFYPKTTLIACVLFSAIVIAILGIVIVAVPQGSRCYDILFALITGAVASFFVSFVVEMANNYRHNKLAWHELQDYYSAVTDFEIHKQAMRQMMPNQRAEKKAREEFLDAGGIEETDEEDEPKDIIAITWKQLPKIVPVFEQTLNHKKEFLNDEEIDELENIISDYEQIKAVIQERILMSPMTYDALNHPDEEFLKSIYPLDVIKNMPEWIKMHLSSKESQKASELYAKAILSDAILLSRFMENYDISQNGLDSYQTEIDKSEEEEPTEEIDYDELDFSEPDDEETFRAQNEEFDRQSELEYRPFVSWLLSKCCMDIAKSVDVLEKSILKKPYYGMMIKYCRDAAKEPIDDSVSMMAYEDKKRQLDKQLAKQKATDECFKEFSDNCR